MASASVVPSSSRRELVATQACHRVAGAHRSQQACSDTLQQGVAGVMAEAVVHRLELVEIDECDGQLVRGGAADAFEGMFDAVEEQQAVGKAGQGVVQRLVAQLRGQPRLVGDVAGGDHPTVHLRGFEVVDDGDLQRHGRRLAGCRRDLPDPGDPFAGGEPSQSLRHVGDARSAVAHHLFKRPAPTTDWPACR